MMLNKITKKDVSDAIKVLTTRDATCWYKPLASTESTGIYVRLGRTKQTTLYFVVGWSKGGYEEDEVGYYEDGYYLVAKIGYQHSNNIMQTDIDIDFNMPYDKKTGEVWDTELVLPKGGFDDADIAWFNKEAQAIWDTYGETGELDLMESKQTESYVLGFNNRFVPKIYAADSKGNSWTSDIEDAYRFNAKPSINRTVKTNFARVATGVYNEYREGGVVEPTDLEIQAISSESCTKKEGCKSSMQKKKESLNHIHEENETLLGYANIYLSNGFIKFDPYCTDDKIVVYRNHTVYTAPNVTTTFSAVAEITNDKVVHKLLGHSAAGGIDDPIAVMEHSVSLISKTATKHLTRALVTAVDAVSYL